MSFNIADIRKDFAILNEKVNDKNLVYLDSAATSLTPNQVIEEITNYYTKYNANYSRGVSTLSNSLTLKVEDIRTKIANFFNIEDSKNVVFTKNATESVNILANGLRNYLSEGDEILISEQEHHANIIPWINVANQTGAVVKYIPINEDGTLQVEQIPNLLSEKTKVFSLNHVSSTLGYENNIKEITKIVREKSNAFVIIDGAQSAGHLEVDLSFKPDGFVCSAHKMFGPTGIGMLYISDEMSKVVEPLTFGGSMVDVASKDTFSVKGLPFKYEAGTLNMAGIFGFGAAIDYINNIGINNIHDHIKSLMKHFNERVKELENIYFFNDLNKSNGVISININNAHSHESSSDLDKYGIETRAGSHCSQIYFGTQKEDNNLRISLYVYNTIEEIDFLIEKLKEISNNWNMSDDDFNYDDFMKELNKLKQGGK